MTLATFEDLEARLGRSLTSDELLRAEALLEDVSASIRSFTGRTFARGEQTIRVRARGGIVRLPQRPVHGVVSVVDMAGNDVPFSWDGLDRVSLRPSIGGSFAFEPSRRSTVVVAITYDAGAEAVPADIVGVAASITLRSLGVDPTETAITQESVDGYAFTVGSIGGSGAYGILPDEARVLRRYVRHGGTMRVGL